MCGDSRSAAGYQHGIAGIENFPARFGALGIHACGKVFGAQSHCDDPRACRGDFLRIHDTQIGFDVAPDFNAPFGQTGLFLDGGNFLIHPFYFAGIFHFWNTDGIRLSPHSSLQVLVQLLGI